MWRRLWRPWTRRCEASTNQMRSKDSTTFVMRRNREQLSSTIVFLGGGRITSAILAGLKVVGSRQRVVVHDHNKSKLKLLHRQYGIKIEPNLERAIVQGDLLFLAVRPDSVPSLLQDMNATFALQSRQETRPRRHVVSLAAGIPLARLRQMLNPHALWARAMPSPVCRTGNGLIALAFDRGFPPRRRDQVRDFFREIGNVLDLPEPKFDAFTVTFPPVTAITRWRPWRTPAENSDLTRKLRSRRLLTLWPTGSTPGGSRQFLWTSYCRKRPLLGERRPPRWQG